MICTLPTRIQRLGTLALGAALVTSGIVALEWSHPSAANAAEENGYVFNDAWTLTGPNVSTPQSPSATAHNTATSQVVSTLGAVDIGATFTPNPARTPGVSYLTNGQTQASYGAAASMFVGTPTPGNVPALGLYTNASEGCGGAVGTTAHLNFNGVCNVGQLTFTFSRPVTDVVLDISGLGGFTSQEINAQVARGSFNATEWTIVSPGVTFSQVPGGAVNLSSDGSKLAVISNNSYIRCDQSTQANAGTDWAMPRPVTAGCGSVILRGTFTSVTFDLGSRATPFSAFPMATYDTGSRYFANGVPDSDGINGLNAVRGETVPGASPIFWNVDLQRVSLRLPETGEVGDKVWSDLNRDGIQGAGEPGVPGVTATLTDSGGAPVLDATGNPITTVTDATGNYLFSGLPLGDYRVKLSNLPSGMVLTAPRSGVDRGVDSDIDQASGLSPVVHLDSVAPADLSIDAGVMVQLGSIGDRVFADGDRDGVQDPGEAGVSGVTVVLYDAAGVEVAQTTTAADGLYSFQGLSLGDYSVGFAGLPAGATFAPQGVGSDPALDSDVNPATGRTATISLTAANPNASHVDVGIESPPAVVVTPAPSGTNPSPSLAVTGTNGSPLAGLAVLLIVLGGLVLVSTRRRWRFNG